MKKLNINEILKSPLPIQEHRHSGHEVLMSGAANACPICQAAEITKLHKQLAESDFGSGLKSMAQNTLSACKLLRDGRWDIDRMERWLKAVIENSRIGDLEESK